jgi:platelet-activating factor acetylhydrolase IB subunit alpha
MCALSFHYSAHNSLENQTARIWDPLTGESKMELRGHENAVEVVAFAPPAAYPAIRELAGIPVCSLFPPYSI